MRQTAWFSLDPSLHWENSVQSTFSVTEMWQDVYKTRVLKSDPPFPEIRSLYKLLWGRKNSTKLFFYILFYFYFYQFFNQQFSLLSSPVFGQSFTGVKLTLWSVCGLHVISSWPLPKFWFVKHTFIHSGQLIICKFYSWIDILKRCGTFFLSFL